MISSIMFAYSPGLASDCKWSMQEINNPMDLISGFMKCFSYTCKQSNQLLAGAFRGMGLGVSCVSPGGCSAVMP